MADNYDKTKGKEVQEEIEEEISHFKLTLTHTHHKGLEKANSEISKKVNQLT